MELIELIYISKASASFSDDDIKAILAVSNSKNRAAGVNGMLIYCEPELIQLLEGEKAAVEKIFAAIKQDSRHYNINVFHQSEIKKRSFEFWPMLFKHINSNSLEIDVPGFEELDFDKMPSDFIKANPAKGKQIFLALRDIVSIQ